MISSITELLAGAPLQSWYAASILYVIIHLYIMVPENNLKFWIAVVYTSIYVYWRTQTTVEYASNLDVIIVPTSVTILWRIVKYAYQKLYKNEKIE